MKKLTRFLCCLLAIIHFGSITAFAAEEIHFYHSDPTGTPIAITDASATVVWRADYKPFGEEHSITSSNHSNDRTFVGKEKDSETGLHYFDARYFDSTIGRFTSPDPVSAMNPFTSRVNYALLTDPQRLNPYAYGLNNPNRYVDPDGNIVWDLVDFGFFAYSLYNFAQDPSLSSGGDVALNAVGLLPFVPSIGLIKFIGKGKGAVKLSGKLAGAFRGGVGIPQTLKHDTIAFRYWGGKALESGAWLTNAKGYKAIGLSSEDAIKMLNLPEGSIASEVSMMVIPKGTKVITGLVEGGVGNALQIYAPNFSNIKSITSVPIK
jgi:RHS repeat-associated protein